MYAWDRPTFWTDPSGHAPGDWYDPRSYVGDNDYARGWRQGLGEGYFENAADMGDRFGRIAVATKDAAVTVVTEPVNAISDVSILTYGAATGDDLADYQLRSGIGRRQQQRVLAGQGGLEAAFKGSAEAGAAGLTFGLSSQVQTYYEIYEGYAGGHLTNDQVEDALINNAGGAIASVPIAAGLSRATGSGWAGPKLSAPQVSINRSEFNFSLPTFEPAFAGAGYGGARVGGGVSISLPTSISVQSWGNGIGPRALAMASMVPPGAGIGLAGSGSGPAGVAKPARPANQGIGPQHGSTVHNAWIDKVAGKLRAMGWLDIRKNQQQVDASGMRVGRNRPDLSGVDPVTGQRTNFEWDTDPSNSARHQAVVPANDPAATSVFVVIDPATGRPLTAVRR